MLLYPQFLATSSLCWCKRSDMAFSLLLPGMTVMLPAIIVGVAKELPDMAFWVHCCA